MEDGKTETKDLVGIVKKYYKFNKDSSHKTIVSVYRTYVQLSKGQEVKKPVKKYKKRRPKNSVGFDKTYGIWIKEEHYRLVTKALHKYGFKSTTKSIVHETRIPQGRVTATLHYMISKREAYMKYDKEGSPVYHPI